MRVDIRSYRAVFDLERRIYKIDRLRLNPSGVPVRGVLYFLAILAAIAILRSLPLVSMPLDLLPWYLNEVALPALSAALLASVKLDGRPFHIAAWASLSYAIGPRELGGHGQRSPSHGRLWRPAELIVLPDGSDAQMRGLLYTGPGAVLVSAPHDRVHWPDGLLTRVLGLPHLTLQPLPGRRLQRRQLVELAPRTRLKVRGSR